MASGPGTRGDSFLPRDPRVEEPYRLTPRLALRLGILGGITLAIFAVLFLRLWALQILSGSEYLATAQDNQLRSVRIEAPRGPIEDRNGRVLVDNVAGTAVQLWPDDLPTRPRRRAAVLRRLAGVLEIPYGRMVRQVRDPARSRLEPVTVKLAASESQVKYLSERLSDFPGVSFPKTFLRHYRYQTLAAHLLGHVGEISPEQLKERRREGYRLADTIGQAGVEATYDAYLRGEAGLAQLRVDSLGRPRSDMTVRRPALAGQALRLTIDIELQRAAERALRKWIKAATTAPDCFGCWAANGGAIVALDPRDGAVRALASNPTFQPRAYVGAQDVVELDRIIGGAAEKENLPGLNRAIQGEYPPGSIFKPVVSLAAMQEGLVGPYESLLCSGEVTMYKQPFANWDGGVYEWMSMARALGVSCDTYFYQLGSRFYELGADRGQPLQRWARIFGLGEETGIDIERESTGLVPTIKWRRRNFTTALERSWKPGDSIQLSIGQKDIKVTPLQMARFYAMLANGGKLVTPHVAANVVKVGSTRTLPGLRPTLPNSVAVDPTAMQVVRDGLYQATHGDGTSAWVFDNFPVAIAGKTGTAEKTVDLGSFSGTVNQSWWCGYGPSDRTAELVVCAVIENGGHGSTAAAPAAREVFQRYFDLDPGEAGEATLVRSE